MLNSAMRLAITLYLYAAASHTCISTPKLTDWLLPDHDLIAESHIRQVSGPFMILPAPQTLYLFYHHC
jgi:hypothetical protein